MSRSKNAGGRPSAARAKANFRSRMRAVVLSMTVGLLLMGAKFAAWHLTGSSAILSDALESIINVVASGFAMISVVTAARPPDESHPYGHGKIEFFSAGFEGALIILAAAGIFHAGIGRIMAPQTLPNLGDGLFILGGAAAINFLLGIFLVRTGKKTDSLTLIADGKHLLADVYTSVGVVAGLLLVPVTGWYRLDGVVACLVGINIVITGFSLVKASVAGLMDASDPRLLAQIADILARSRSERWIDIHRLRAWKSGNHIHVDLHVVLPRDLNLHMAHRESKNIESVLERGFAGDASVLVHMDPCTAPDCPVCEKTRCEMRSTREQKPASWDAASLTARRADTPEPGAGRSRDHADGERSPDG